MAAVLRWALGLVGVLIVLFLAASFWVSRPAFDEPRGAFDPQIADPSVALTFARSDEGLLWITGHDGDRLRGVNLTTIHGEAETADLLRFYRKLGKASLIALRAAEEFFPLTDLVPPVEYAYPYVAAGTNFKEHAEEVYLDDPPFLFPKLARASGWRDAVPFTSRLDFEAELCMFPLEDIHAPDALPDFGLVLCNDFTDRWKLIRELDLGAPMGTTGFATGKGCMGCMPTGYLVVIPQKEDFYRKLELSLYVNDALRQRFSMSDIILSIEGIVSQAFEQREESYSRGTELASLLPQGHIPRGTLLLTGTAAGVIFKPLNLWNQRLYLQPGDVVRTEGSFLGHLENQIAIQEVAPAY